VPEDGTKEQDTVDAQGSPSGSPRRAGTADVFLSYASADKATADTICAAVERAGITCWIAILPWPGCSRILRSPGDGESGARARLAFRTSSVAPPVGQSHPLAKLSWCESTEPRERRPSFLAI
jgi:hypothetical protein